MPQAFKHPVKIIGYEPMEIELYFAAGTLRGKLGSSVPQLHPLLNSLEDYINGAIVQYHRILEDRVLADKLLLQSRQSPFDRSLSDTSFVHLLLAFLNIHYYAICIDKIDKLYRKLLTSIAPLAQRSDSHNELRSKRIIAEKLLSQTLTPVTNARNYLEHIETKIIKGNFAGLSLEMNDSGSRFTFGAGSEQRTVDLGGLEQIEKAYEALVEYVAALPDAE